MKECPHTYTQTRAGERGSWCIACGVKVYEVDPRRCEDCTSFSREWNHSRVGICKQHWMRVTDDMNVTFRITEGTCFTPKDSPCTN